MGMNRTLLSRVRDRIAEVGTEHCNMRAWSIGPMVGSGEPECGTAACIGGHTLAMRYGSFYVDTTRIADPAARARDLLGLPSEALFYASFWPDHFRSILNVEGSVNAMLALCDALLDETVIFDGVGMLVDTLESER